MTLYLSPELIQGFSCEMANPLNPNIPVIMNGDARTAPGQLGVLAVFATEEDARIHAGKDAKLIVLEGDFALTRIRDRIKKDE